MSDTYVYDVCVHDLPKFEKGELPSYSALRKMIRANSELSERDRVTGEYVGFLILFGTLILGTLDLIRLKI